MRLAAVVVALLLSAPALAQRIERADKTCNDASVTCLFAASSSEGGAATTALALAGNPNDCSANQYATTIAASGDLSCAQVAFSELSGSATDTQIPNNITIDLAATATALAANGGNCSAGQYPLGVDAAGAVESCTADDDAPEAGDMPAGSNQTTFTIDADNTGGSEPANGAGYRIEGGSGDVTALYDATDNQLDFAGAASGYTFDAAVVANVTGNVTGNASTATALASNPTDCSANQFANAIAANGNLTCAGLVDGDIPAAIARDSEVPSLETDPGVPLLALADLGDLCAGSESTRRNAGDTANECFTPGDITSVGTCTSGACTLTLGTDTDGNYAGSASEGGPATTALALNANGGNCSAGNYPLGVDASGAVETCTADDDVPESGDFGALTGGAGITNTAGTLATASTEAAFLADGGTTSLTCGSSAGGKMQVMDDGTIEYCDGATTSVLRTLKAFGPLIEADEMAVTLTPETGQTIDLNTHDATLKLATVTGAPGTAVIQLDASADTLEWDTGGGDRSAVDRETAQTISGAKTFSAATTASGGLAGQTEVSVGGATINAATYAALYLDDAVSVDGAFGAFAMMRSASTVTLDGDGVLPQWIQHSDTYTSPTNEVRSVTLPFATFEEASTISLNSNAGAASAAGLNAFFARPTFNRSGTANASCTGSGAPVACCTGSGTGNCTATYTTGRSFYSGPTVTGAQTTVTTYVHFTGADMAGTGVNTTQLFLDVPALAKATTNIGIRNASTLVETPPSAQAITAVGNTITVASAYKTISANGNYTLTSTPTIADGQSGQVVTIRNVDTGTDVVTLQDQGTLASSNLRLGANTRALGPRDSIRLRYDSTVGDWVEEGFFDVL
jgi:hypothetical protein